MAQEESLVPVVPILIANLIGLDDPSWDRIELRKVKKNKKIIWHFGIFAEIVFNVITLTCWVFIDM